MIRTQIQLDEEQARALKNEAARRGVSMAELIRQSVERFLSDADYDAMWDRAMRVIGKYSTGPTDVSVNHDKYLDEDLS